MKLALAAVAALTVASAAHAAPRIEAAWSRPAAKGTTAAGFMTLRNPGGPADALVAVASPLAGGVMIHQSGMSGGMASMQMLDRVPVAPGATVEFKPGGYHLMFMDLARSLKVGDRLPATLSFASGAKVKAVFVVSVTPPVVPPRP